MSELPNTLLLDIGNSQVHWQFGNQFGSQNLKSQVFTSATFDLNQVARVYCSAVSHAQQWGWLQVVLRHAQWVQCTVPNQALLATLYDPNQLGIDRWLAMVGTRFVHHISSLSLVVDVGTAITLDVLDQQGHQGGWICPGLRTWTQGITDHTPICVDSVASLQPKFGLTSAEAIQFGWLVAATSLIENTLFKLKSAQLVLTGGDAQLLMPYLPSAKCFDYLVLDGLAHWAKVCIKTE